MRHTPKRGKSMQPMTNIDGNVSSRTGTQLAVHTMLMEGWISPKVDESSHRHAQRLYQYTNKKGMRTLTMGAQWKLATQVHGL